MKQRTAMLTYVTTGIALAVGLVVALLVFAGRYGGPGTPAAEMYAYDAHRGEPGDLSVLWTVPDFAFPDQDGRQVTPASLKGHVWIADFIFTQCTTVCPTLTAKMVQLQRRLPDPELRFVSFSVDPEHDTPAVLKAYAKRWRPDEARWRLLATQPDTLAAVAKAMRVAVAKTDDPENPIVHSSVFLLVDGEGRVRGVYDTADTASIERLAVDTRGLAGPVSGQLAAAAGDGDGAKLYASLGCGACHDQPKLAPALGGLAGRAVTLEDGTTVLADAAYVRESIESPGRKIVKGYLELMPSYHGQLTEAQLTNLVGYVLELPASGAGAKAEAAATLAVDPVCGMKVRVTKETPSFTYGGKTYHFCSDHCRTQFAADPKKFLAEGPKPMKGMPEGHGAMPMK